MIKFLLKLVLSLYPYGLFIVFIQNTIYTPNFDFFSWDFMCYWIIYIIPISYYLFFIFFLHKEIFVFYKDLFFKEKGEGIVKLLFVLTTPPVFIPSFYGDKDFRNKDDKCFFSYINKIFHTTFFISIYLFYDRFVENSLFQIELLSGDLLFLIIPFILSSIFVVNNSFQKFQNIDE